MHDAQPVGDTLKYRRTRSHSTRPWPRTRTDRAQKRRANRWLVRRRRMGETPPPCQDARIYRPAARESQDWLAVWSEPCRFVIRRSRQKLIWHAFDVEGAAMLPRLVEQVMKRGRYDERVDALCLPSMRQFVRAVVPSHTRPPGIGVHIPDRRRTHDTATLNRVSHCPNVPSRNINAWAVWRCAGVA